MGEFIRTEPSDVLGGDRAVGEIGVCKLENSLKNMGDKNNVGTPPFVIT